MARKEYRSLGQRIRNNCQLFYVLLQAQRDEFGFGLKNVRKLVKNQQNGE